MNQKEQIQHFEEKKICTVWDDEKEEWFFSVVDVVEVLTDSADPKQYIKKMRARDPELNAGWGTICTLTRMTASDGKCYRTQATDLKGSLVTASSHARKPPIIFLQPTVGTHCPKKRMRMNKS